MVIAKEAYRAMLRDAIAPALREMGFKGSGRLYMMDDDRSWVRLGFQASQFNTADEVSFTINLAVVDKDTWRRQRQERSYLPDVPSPGTYYGVPFWQTRIGHVMPERRDVWWALSTGEAVGPVVSEVLAAIRDCAIPALTEQRSKAPPD